MIQETVSVENSALSTKSKARFPRAERGGGVSEIRSRLEFDHPDTRCNEARFLGIRNGETREIPVLRENGRIDYLFEEDSLFVAALIPEKSARRELERGKVN